MFISACNSPSNFWSILFIIALITELYSFLQAHFYSYSVAYDTFTNLRIKLTHLSLFQSTHFGNRSSFHSCGVPFSVGVFHTSCVKEANVNNVVFGSGFSLLLSHWIGHMVSFLLSQVLNLFFPYCILMKQIKVMRLPVFE